MKIEFTKSTCGIGYAYLEGMTLDCSDAFGTEMVNLGYAEIITNSPDGLPEDIPGREALLKAGFKTIAEIMAIPDLTEIEGIEEATAAKIVAYLTK